MGTTSAISQIGVPVRAVNRAQLYPGRDRCGAACLYATMSQQAANFFVLQIDPVTGAARQFTVAVPESNYTTAVHMGRDGRLYIGAAHSGHLFCFDPVVDGLVDLGQITPTAYSQTECFDAGVTFARAEGIVPAPEANHAVKGAITEALQCKEEGESRAILFNVCGHGYFDMQAYTDYNAGKLEDHAYDESEVAMALAGLPSVA